MNAPHPYRKATPLESLEQILTDARALALRLKDQCNPLISNAYIRERLINFAAGIEAAMCDMTAAQVDGAATKDDKPVPIPGGMLSGGMQVVHLEAFAPEESVSTPTEFGMSTDGAFHIEIGEEVICLRPEEVERMQLALNARADLLAALRAGQGVLL